MTAVTEAEILLELAMLPAGKRRSGLEEAVRVTFETEFEGRVLVFDSDAARDYAQIGAARRQLGRPISVIDAQIAAIARSRLASVATRNTADFDQCGVSVVESLGRC